MRTLAALFSGWTSVAAAVGTCAQDAGSVPQEAAPAAKPSPAESPRPNLVLVTIDTLRADHLSCYGYFRKTSPRIDQLAAESLLFTRCYSTIPHTTPSHCSILTGVMPLEHGILANSFQASAADQRRRAFVPTPQLRSYAQIVQAHGWKTGGFVSSATTKQITGLANGFDGWDEPKGLYRKGDETLAAAEQWLDQNGKEPFFLWLHLFDVHGPHEPDAKYSDAFTVDAALATHMREREVPDQFDRKGEPLAHPPVVICGYDASIRRVDDLIGELLQKLEAIGAWPRTTFVLTSDHGEGLGQHQFIAHALVWGEQLQVPLIVRVPGRAPARLDTLLSSVDLLPTVVDLTPGLPREELFAQAHGRSAVAKDFDERAVFSMSPTEKNEFSLTTQNWKYIHRPGKGRNDELFDLRKDPHELHDVKESEPKIANSLKTQLLLMMKEQREKRRYYLQGGVEPTLSPEDEKKLNEALKALGYIDGENGDAKEGDGGHDPPPPVAPKKDGG